MYTKTALKLTSQIYYNHILVRHQPKHRQQVLVVQ